MPFDGNWNESDVLTKQDIFNQVWDWFIVKGNPKGRNMYRSGTTGQLRCAVGVLLTDEEVRGLRAPNVATLDREVADPVECTVAGVWDSLPARLRAHSRQFLGALQNHHDNWPSAKFAPGYWEGFATDHGLTVPA